MGAGAQVPMQVTAGSRVLSIDGGGIRAVIPIQFLRALERAIGLDMPVQEHSDFSYGTSSGSMVNLALYGLGMRVDEVSTLFSQLGRRVFRGRNRFGFGFAAATHSLLTSYPNGLHPAEDIDGPLSEIFGDTAMTDHPYMSSIRARIGFPIVDVDSSQTPQTCIVTSYNGAGSKWRRAKADDKVTYRVLQANNPDNEIRIKDVARWPFAAPWYFTAHEIPSHGVFMDGGMSDNNPSQLALRELGKVMPKVGLLDQFVSIGTGMCTVKQTDGKAAGSSLAFSKGSIYQAFDHYMEHNFNGDARFDDMRHNLSTAHCNKGASVDRWFRRFNLLLDAGLPDLADAPAMDGLAEAAWVHFASDPALPYLTFSIQLLAIAPQTTAIYVLDYTHAPAISFYFLRALAFGLCTLQKPITLSFHER